MQCQSAPLLTKWDTQGLTARGTTASAMLLNLFGSRKILTARSLMGAAMNLLWVSMHANTEESAASTQSSTAI